MGVLPVKRTNGRRLSGGRYREEVPPRHCAAAELKCYGISEVLHQLAALYFGETGRRELVDLNTTVKSVVALLRVCVSSRIEIDCNLHADPLPITVDAVWLQRVLVMLAVLAAAPTAEAATLTFKTSSGSHAAVTLESEHFSDRSARGDREVYALREVARFAAAHAGRFEETSGRITVALPLDDLDAPLAKNSEA